MIDDTVRGKYEIFAKIGKGAYGIVWKGIEKVSLKMVAIKKIYDAFTNNTEFTQKLLVHIKHKLDKKYV